MADADIPLLAVLQADVPPLDVGAAITRVTTAVGERVLAVRAMTGLTAAQLQVLRLALDGSSMNALAERLGAPKSTLTSVVDQLTAAGLAERTTDDADRRRQIVTVTSEGAAVIEDFDGALALKVEALLEGLPADRRARLGELLGRLPEPGMPVPLA